MDNIGEIGGNRCLVECTGLNAEYTYGCTPPVRPRCVIKRGMAEPPTGSRFREIAAQQMAAASVAPVQLRFWPDDRRGAPNALLRSALFSAGKPTNTRKLFKQHTLAVLGPCTISYTGPQLYQPELDVWLELVHRCRLRELGTGTEFPVRSFLKSLGRSAGKSDYKALVGTFRLLASTLIEVAARDDKGRVRGYMGHLVDSLEHNEATGGWRATLNPKIASLFAPSEHTWLHAGARQALGRSFLAKWLHGYFSTHQAPFPISVERLRELSGSSTKQQLRDFRRSVRKALDEVAAVERADGRGFEWLIEDDVVHVRRGQGPAATSQS